MCAVRRAARNARQAPSLSRMSRPSGLAERIALRHLNTHLSHRLAVKQNQCLGILPAKNFLKFLNIYLTYEFIGCLDVMLCAKGQRLAMEAFMASQARRFDRDRMATCGKAGTAQAHPRGAMSSVPSEKIEKVMQAMHLTNTCGAAGSSEPAQPSAVFSRLGTTNHSRGRPRAAVLHQCNIREKRQKCCISLHFVASHDISA